MVAPADGALPKFIAILAQVMAQMQNRSAGSGGMQEKGRMFPKLSIDSCEN